MGALFLIFVVPAITAFSPMFIAHFFIRFLNVSRKLSIVAAVISLAIIACFMRLSYLAFGIGEGDPNVPISYGAIQVVWLLIWTIYLLISCKKLKP
jgi:hypothetical protein